MRVERGIGDERSTAEKHARWVVLAAAAHVMMAAAIICVPVRSAQRPESNAYGTTLEVTVEGAVPEVAAVMPPAVSERPRAAREAPSHAPDHASATASAGVAVIGSSRPASGNELAPASNSDATAFIGPAANGEASGFSAAMPPTAEQLGIAGTGTTNPFLPKHDAPDTTNEPRRVLLRGTGLARDTELGLGPEGPALSALSDETRRSIAPLRGRAIFLVTSDRDGVVASVDLIDSEGGGGWLDAGKLALEALKAKRFRVPRGANGLAMRIEVRSEMKLPNGEDAPVGVRPGEQRMRELTLPDLSNIGAHAQRVVKSRILETDIL